jgi:hypothetical protein
MNVSNLQFVKAHPFLRKRGRSGDVAPRFASADRRYQLGRHSKGSSNRLDLFSSGKPTQYVDNIRFGKYGVRIGFTGGALTPVTLHPISNIVRVCSKVKMFWVAASPIITCVQNVKPIGNRSSKVLIANSVCSEPSTSERYVTVPAGGSSHPFPASFMAKDVGNNSAPLRTEFNIRGNFRSACGT